MAQTREVDAHGSTVEDTPGTGDHDAVGAMRAAQDKRGDGITGTGKTQFVESVKGEIGLLAGGDAADVGASKAARGAFRGPAKGVEMSDGSGAVAKAVEHERVTDAFHEIGIVIRGGAVNAEADDGACGFEFLGAALSRSENHVGRGAMANADFVAAKPLDFGFVEMNAVGEPGATGEPLDLFKIIERAAIEMGQAIVVLVARFGEMRVQLAIEASGQTRGGDHDLPANHEGSTRRKRNLAEGALGWIVEARKCVLAGGKSCVFVFDESVVGQASFRSAEVDRAPSERHAHAER